MKSPADAVSRHDSVTLPQPATGRYVWMLGKERRSFYNPAPATAQFGYRTSWVVLRASAWG